MRSGFRAAAVCALLALASAAPATSVFAEDITVGAVQVTTFRGAAPGARVQDLIFEGGLELSSPAPDFGGLSGITFLDDARAAVMVSDQGDFVSGTLIYDEAGRPAELVGVAIEPIQNSRGADLPRAFARDAEAVHVIMRDGVATGVRVGFENLTRVADFELRDKRPGGPAREVAIPERLTDLRTNRSIESVCIAPPASPVAGSTLLIAEDLKTSEGNHSAWLLGRQDRGPLSFAATSGVYPTDCAFLPDGDLLVLERGVGFLTFTMTLKRVPAAEVRPGAVMTGEVLLAVSGGEIDNMEGLAVHPGPDGRPRITVLSDNNFNDWQRTLLLQFSLPD